MSDSIYVRLGVPTSLRSQDGPCGHLGSIKACESGSRPSWGPLPAQDGTSRPLRAPQKRASGQVRTPRSGPSPGSSDVDQPDRCMPAVAQGKKGTILAGSLGCGWVRRFAASDGRRRAGLPRHMAALNVLAPFSSLLANLSLVSATWAQSCRCTIHAGRRQPTGMPTCKLD